MIRSALLITALAGLAAALPVTAQTSPAPAPAAPPAQTPPATPAAPPPVAQSAPAPAPAALAPLVPPSPMPSITDAANTWLLDLSTGGRVTILFRPDVAPTMVDRVKTLTRQHFYDGLVFHRVIEGFMAQGGDPKGDGTGGSPLPNLPAEFNNLPHTRGAVAAARAEDKNSANSQFFIVFSPVLKLDRKYTVFGRVIDGMQYVDAIERGEPPANPTRVLHAYIASDSPPAYRPAPPAPAAALAPATLPGAATVSSTPAAVSPAKPAARRTRR